MQFNLTLWKDVPDQLRTLISFKDGSVAVMHLKASGNRGVWSLVAARPTGFAFQSGRARVVLTPPATIHPGLSMVDSQCPIHVQTGEARLCAGGRESWTIGLYNSHSRPASLAPLIDSEQEGLLRKAMAMPRAGREVHCG